MKRFVAYYRVSTAKQGHSGLGLEAQQQAVRQYLNGGAWELVGEFTEVESGKKNDRPQLAAALAACRRFKATLVIAKLDRLARNVAFIANLMEAGTDFVAVDMPEANKLVLHIMAAMAQHEREAISARTKAALAAAKARGTKLGGFRGVKVNQAMGAQANAERAREWAQGEIGQEVADMKARGWSLWEIAHHLNDLGVKTRRGGEWQATTVKRVLDKVAEAG
ncbi:recombinase family protein [Oleispirillum naphthae]|uniref:recombinase family protein n=1 Tax=Oleispirillum naphthae TaxID=2838853 RepID=UPI0030825FA1